MFKEYRKKKKLTQEKVAELLNISTRHYQRIEKYENEPSLALLREIIKVLNIQEKDIVKYIKKEY